MSNPNALFLLADHVKLSLLERQRAKTLGLGSDTQDGHLSRSLEQFRDGLESLQKEQKRLEEAGDETKAANIADSLRDLQEQYNDLTSQFHGFSSPAPTTTTPSSEPLLIDDSSAKPTNTPTASSSNPPVARKPSVPKTVRFSSPTPDLEAQLPGFGPYRDDPALDDPDSAGYRRRVEDSSMSNEQIYKYNSDIIGEQDEQLDALGFSLNRLRVLGDGMGEELDRHGRMLDETANIADQHQGSLDRARTHVGKVARAAGESKQMVAIVILIIVLVLLIVASK